MKQINTATLQCTKPFEFLVQAVTKMNKVTGKQTQMYTHFSVRSDHLCVISSRHFPSGGLCSARQTGNLTGRETHGKWTSQNSQRENTHNDATYKTAWSTERLLPVTMTTRWQGPTSRTLHTLMLHVVGATLQTSNSDESTLKSWTMRVYLY